MSLYETKLKHLPSVLGRDVYAHERDSSLLFQSHLFTVLNCCMCELLCVVSHVLNRLHLSCVQLLLLLRKATAAVVAAVN